MLHPDFPVVEGRYRMNRDWFVDLPGRFNRRLNGDELVLWRPGLAIWVEAWNNDDREAKDVRFQRLKREMPGEAFAVEEPEDEDVLRLGFRLEDGKEGDAFRCYAVGEDGHVRMSIRCEDEKELEAARAIWLSLSERKPESAPNV